MKRLFPCPYHNIPTAQRWLEDMAQRGLILQKESVRFGLASFAQAEPRALRYRILPAPHEEEVIHEPEGWEYITSRSGDMDYQIFASADPCAPEPPAKEPELAAALKRSTTLFGFMAILVVSMVYDDFTQLPLSAGTAALDGALLALLLERACALYLLNQTQKGQRGKLSTPAYYGSLALRCLCGIALILAAVLYAV